MVEQLETEEGMRCSTYFMAPFLGLFAICQVLYVCFHLQAFACAFLYVWDIFYYYMTCICLFPGSSPESINCLRLGTLFDSVLLSPVPSI